MTREVLKLALEALENLGDASDRDVSPAKWDASGAQEAWEAIKAALAQPEQGPVAWPTMPPSIGQSPVLFESGYDEGWAKCMSMCKAAMTSPPKRQPDDFDSWYASPYAKVLMKSIEEDYSPKRQPLTGQQLIDLEMNLRKYSGKDGYDLSLSEFARAIELHHDIGNKT